MSLAREIVYLHLANARKRLNAHSSIELLYIVSGGISIDCTIIKLSPRGEEIFKFIMQGWSGKQISNHLGIRECPAYILLYQFSPKDTGQSKVK